MNETTNLTVSLSEKAHSYEIRVGTGVLPSLGVFAHSCLPKKARRVAVVSNKKVFGLYGETTVKSLRLAGFDVAVFLMPDGEQYKNFKILTEVLAFFSANKLARSDAVVALGGGVVGDLTGFAAAIYQRGIAFLQVPTTIVAMIDSSVGGKTAVNTALGKNLIGAFHQPHGVFVDTDVLRTLPRREVVAGFCEAIKHGAIGDKQLFAQTDDFLQKFPLKSFRSFFKRTDKTAFLVELEELIVENIRFKAKIVIGDEREDTDREDARSRRILNFGHTVGHALEKATNYRRLKHGEAVGYGMLVAANISEGLGKINQFELDLFSNIVRRVGKLPVTNNIPLEAITGAFIHDKKAVGDSFKWILLDEIGRAAIVDNKDIPEEIIRKAISFALQI